MGSLPKVCKARAMDIGILGGTGPAGKALAVRLASVGMSVSIGSRSAERGQETAAQLREKWATRNLELRGAANEVACEADLVVVATPWDGAPHTVAGLADHLEGKVVVSMANALFKVGDDIEAVVPARGSLCVAVQDRRRLVPWSRAPSTTCPLAVSPILRSPSTPTCSSAQTTRQRPRPPSRSSTGSRDVAALTPGPCRRRLRSRPSPPCSSGSTSATVPMRASG